MIANTRNNWHEANQRYLSAALAVVRECLEKHVARLQGTNDSGAQSSGTQERLAKAGAAMPAASALERLCSTFGLSNFERGVLLLCAGVELESQFASRCSAAQGDPARPFPTFSLALAALPEAHWSALSPEAPLRFWKLIEVSAGVSLTMSALRIDERILHYLAGVQHCDERLAGIIEPLRFTDELPESHAAVARQIAAAWSRPPAGTVLQLIQLCGPDIAARRAIGSAAAAASGLLLSVVSAQALPAASGELEALARLWERESVLNASALLLECDDVDASDIAHDRAISKFAERVKGALLLAGRERRNVRQRPLITFDVGRPTSDEQRAIWDKVLGESRVSLNGSIDRVVSHFNLSPPAIRAAGAEALVRFQSTVYEGSRADSEMTQALWDACRAQARPRLDDLAQRIPNVAQWADLVLPERQLRVLKDIAVQVRHRTTVYKAWGFEKKSARGLGISALFAGPSGTGKTMAAEVLAGELELDLYRIDLSAVVSKYIGETEKNLRRVFDAAEEGGAILLFDEADALFGKRSEVKDSHDRYANIEVSYLLQRMEAYSGLAILTTNLKTALDSAFLRRIRFVVDFPFPDLAHRLDIWRRTFPPNTPTERLDLDKLARLNLAGGNIRNIALNAAFFAADAGEPVRMSHLLRAARTEYEKLEKPLTEAEIGGWV